ncbi:hypothetical protein [Pseudomonas sp. LAIL14HWK12:I7]|uniref:hypothetical protein n=1 Tax=Pseudomonas sp. LAIL14HWK12:I7 TaxID=1259801 RepID=UPI0012DDECE4|nr:hypothetical protein [Pseudomonas sp. LAIL14HWK12:I7]
MQKLRDSFGEEFDHLPFQTGDGRSLEGADFNGVTTGCEILDRQGLGWMCQCRSFDERLKFESDDGQIRSGTKYKVSLSGGHVVTGCTDDLGCTERIRSSEAVHLEKIEFLVDDIETCCGSGNPEPIVLSVDLPGIKTSKEGFGESERKVTVKRGCRPLSGGEIELARLLFKEVVNYDAVRVYNKQYLPFQPEKMAIAPNGNIYFHPADFQEDFSVASASLKRWFIHEMTHVWQRQLGYPVFWRGAARVGLRYEYELVEGMRLGDYNMEAQGDVLADYFSIKF